MIAGIEEPDARAASLQVEDMNDGGMGSLKLAVPTSARPRSGRVACRAAVQFTDADGVEVVASLNADEDGMPFELDMWKTDFTALISIPLQFRPLDD